MLQVAFAIKIREFLEFFKFPYGKYTYSLIDIVDDDPSTSSSSVNAEIISFLSPASHTPSSAPRSHFVALAACDSNLSSCGCCCLSGFGRFETRASVSFTSLT